MRPGYTKPIDTFEDFVDQGKVSVSKLKGISWLSRRNLTSVLETLNTSTRPAFNNMYKNFVYESSNEEVLFV